MDISGYIHAPIQYPSLHVFDVTQEAAALQSAYHNVVLNRINAGCLRLAVMTGEYPWHSHPRSDELFLVVEGCLIIDVADGPSLALKPWNAVTIPAGTIHRTRADVRTVNLCFEELAADTVFIDANVSQPNASGSRDTQRTPRHR